MTNILELEELIHETIAANITVTKIYDKYIYSCTDDIQPFYTGEGNTREEALLDMYENIKNNKTY